MAKEMGAFPVVFMNGHVQFCVGKNCCKNSLLEGEGEQQPSQGLVLSHRCQ
jgi:hypothetical protein